MTPTYQVQCNEVLDQSLWTVVYETESLTGAREVLGMYRPEGVHARLVTITKTVYAPYGEL